MIIAVDGPAASGKGTIAPGLARHYELKRLDTDSLCRAVAFDPQTFSCQFSIPGNFKNTASRDGWR